MLFDKIGSIIVPQRFAEHQDPPSGFVRKLQSIFGPDMHVAWNGRKKRWVIEQCVGHNGSDQPNADGVVAHTHLCSRTYVWLVAGEESDYMPLGDRVIEKLHEKETYRKYGTGEAALERFRRESRNFDEEQQQKQRERSREILRQNSKDNRTYWNKLKMLFERHSMQPNR